VPKSLRSSLGFAAYRKFAAATRNAARSVSSISLHRKSPRSSLQAVKLAPQEKAVPVGDFIKDLILGAAALVGSALAVIMGYVFAGNSSMSGLFWVFGVTAVLGAFFFARGICRFMAKR
jgi:hypothetical protein